MKLAGDPHQRFRLFLLALILFVAAVACLYAGLEVQPQGTLSLWLTRCGTLTLFIALSLCAYAYLTLLIGRLVNFWQD